ncbi:MAG: hypothetical protein IKI84_04125 [Clostridia bacterium]|nr:hypothetical protein [Clostridia bacterium]
MFKGAMIRENERGPSMKRLFSAVFCLCLVFPILIPASPVYADYLHEPVVEAFADSPTGKKTTWKCVYFGAYPSSEIADSSWMAVDGYALRDGDLIRDDLLYAKLSESDWQENDILVLDGMTYVRVGLDHAPREAGAREQHYAWDYKRPWHYFAILPIRWRILDIRDGKALLLADRMPDCVPFNCEDEEVRWENCTLRSWLNGYGADANRQGIDYTGAGFIDRAFTAEERGAIVPFRCVNRENRDYGTPGGADTADRLFILSNGEVFEDGDSGRYGFDPGRDHDDPAKRFTSTLYAKCMGAWWSPVEDYAGNSFWFMRTSGYTARSVTYVCDFGYIYSKGTLVTCSDAAVLPAMWVDLEKAQLADAGETCSAEIIHFSPSGENDRASDISDPVVIPDSDMPGGAYTVWNAVAFGQYPQTEIVKGSPAESGDDGRIADPKLFAELEAAIETGRDHVTLDGTRYCRFKGRWFRYDPIVWRVLEVKDGTALLMADKCLESIPYHSEYKDVFWEDSGMRKWLNGEKDAPSYGAPFINAAFTDEERRAIAVTAVNNASNYYFGTACGSGTHDRVFILSEEETFCSDKAEKYGFRPSDSVPDTGRRLRPTPYAVARGAWVSADTETAGIGFWLLRTNGYTRDNIVYVGEKGYLYNRGIPVTCADAGIVPVIRIRLDIAQYQRVPDISSRR